MALSLSSSEPAVQWDYCKPAVGAADPPLIRNSYPWMLDCSSPHFALVTAETAVMVSDERGGSNFFCIRSPQNFAVQHIIRKESEWIVIQSVRKWESPCCGGEESLFGEKKRIFVMAPLLQTSILTDWLLCLPFRFFNSCSLPNYKCTSNQHVHIWVFIILKGTELAKT